MRLEDSQKKKLKPFLILFRLTSLLSIKKTLSDTSARVGEGFLCGQRLSSTEKFSNATRKKSVHIVNKILESFKSGKKDAAEFWIQMGDRLVYIRYFAVRDKDGKYLGTMEVAQDITYIKKIEGEKDF